MKLKHLFGVLAASIATVGGGAQAQQAGYTFTPGGGFTVGTAIDGAPLDTSVPGGGTVALSVASAAGAKVILSPSGVGRLNTTAANGWVSYVASVTPATSGEYAQADYTLKSTGVLNYFGPSVRTGSGGLTTGYYGEYNASNGFQICRGYNANFGAHVAYTASLSDVGYRIKITVVNNSATPANADMTLTVQRLLDMNYLTSGGTWQAGATTCETLTDSGGGGTPFTAAGQYGFWIFDNNTSPSDTTSTQIDNFVAGTFPATATPATGYSLTGPGALTQGVGATYTLSTVLTGNSPATTDTVTYSDNLGTHGTFSPATQSVATSGATSFTTTYTAPAAYTGSVTLTATSANGLTAGTATATVSVPAPSLTVANANLYFSPYNWYSDGAGTLQANNVKASSTYAQTANPGAYFKTAVASTTASGNVKVNLDTSMMGAITAANCPVIEWSIDGGQVSTQQLVYGATPPYQVTLSSSLSAGTHTVQVWFRSVDLSGSTSMGDRWAAPTSVVKLASPALTLDANSSLSAPTIHPKKALVYWDSQGEGAQNLSTALTVSGQDAIETAATFVPTALDAEVGMVCFSAQGTTVAGYGGVPVLTTAWSNYFNGQSRLYTGGGAAGGTLLMPAPDYVFDFHGTNDRSTASGTVQTAVQTMIGNYRTAAPLANVFEIVEPYGPYARAPKSAAVSAYLAANPAETKVSLIDVGTQYDPFFNTNGLWMSGATLHETVQGHASYAALVTKAVQAKLGGTSTVIRRRIQ